MAKPIQCCKLKKKKKKKGKKKNEKEMYEKYLFISVPMDSALKWLSCV